jgi:hypothetical protein
MGHLSFEHTQKKEKIIIQPTLIFAVHCSAFVASMEENSTKRIGKYLNIKSEEKLTEKKCKL